MAVRNQSITRYICRLLICFLPLPHSIYAADCLQTSPGNIENRFQLLADGNAFDKYTGLTWFRCNLGEVWDESAQGCFGFGLRQTWREQLQSLAEYNTEQLDIGKPYDWRMPNIKELSSLVNVNCTNMAVDTLIFPTIQNVYWSSTPYAKKVLSKPVFDTTDGTTIVGYQDANGIWTMNMLTGKEDTSSNADLDKRYVLLVRGKSAP